MFFWLREMAGWALIAVSLYIIRTGFRFVDQRQIFEAGTILFAALLVMRCGTVLIRLNTVARIALQMENVGDGGGKRIP